MLKALLALLILVTSAVSKGANIGLIENSTTVKAVQINTASYQWKVFQGTPSNKAIFSFNTNYYWNGVPIGLIYDQDKSLKSTIYANSNRPIFVIKDGKADIVYRTGDYQLASQVGPTLLDGGAYVPERLKKEGLYGSDSVRKTCHVAIGVRDNGKVIVAYFGKASMGEMASWFGKRGCVRAMKCDGGHSCFFWFGKIKIGKSVRAGVEVI